MKRNVPVTIALLATLAAVSREAGAVPSFARQTGASCSACHFQHFPALTRYGRAFKSGGFTQAGGQGLIEGELLSLSAALNASVVTKIRYVKTSGSTGKGTDLGELQFPDEAAVWLGGRVGTNVGFVLEAQLADPDAPMFASFKMPIGFDVAGGRLSAVPFSTDALGAPFGLELLNTGAVRNVRMLEDRTAISAQQYVVGGSEEGEAEGVALAYTRDEGFINLTPWTPHHGATTIDRPTWYLRGAVTPTIGGWELGAGLQWWTGSPQRGSETDAWAADLQAQGRLGRFPAGIYMTYARAHGTPYPESGFVKNFFNLNPLPQSAFAAAAELGLWPGRITLGGGYRRGVTGQALNDRDDTGLFGATLQLAQNVQIQVNHVMGRGNVWTNRDGRQKTIVMLFAGL